MKLYRIEYNVVAYVAVEGDCNAEDVPDIETAQRRDHRWHGRWTDECIADTKAPEPFGCDLLDGEEDILLYDEAADKEMSVGQWLEKQNL